MAQLAISDQSYEEECEARREAEQAQKEAEERAEQERQRAEQAEENVRVESEARRKAELKARRVNKFMTRSSIKENKLEWIYIATTKKYAKERIFKPGSTERITKRIGDYATGHPKKDTYFYVWVKKCYNSKDLDNHIQKMLHLFKYKERSNDTGRHELVHGIKLADLIAIVDFISDNYDANVDYVNNFIKNRLDASLEEDDPEPVPLDIKTITCQIGDHIETIDINDDDSIKDTFDDILTSLKEQRERNNGCIDEPLVLKRKAILDQIVKKVKGVPLKDVWVQLKDYTHWTSSKDELEDGGFKYKIVY
jgi:hypothetical protein